MKLEKRTFINQDKAKEIINFLDSNSDKSEIEKQIIYVYHTEGDFRIVRTKDYIKMNLRKEDNENNVFIAPKYDLNLITMFNNLGISIDLKRFRIRHKYLLGKYYITLDENLKFGNTIRIRLEKDSDKADIELEIDNLFRELGLSETSMDKFDELYSKYRMDWQNLIKDIDELEFLK